MKIIPFGDRILVKRRVAGEKAGESSLIHLPDSAKERPTDLADVVYVPDLSVADKEIFENAELAIDSFSEKYRHGDTEAFKMLGALNEFLLLKSIKVGDTVFISKYVGTDFHDNRGGENLTLVKLTDVIGVVTND